jgi:AAA15 family ATPase/GTPase
MITFSWKKVNDILEWNATSVLQYFYTKQGVQIPNNFILLRNMPNRAKLLAQEKYPKGPCFLINIDRALRNASDPNHLYMYLELASKRNIFDYNIRGVLYLPEVMIPEYLKVWVERNPMLEKKEDKIYFKYEQE